MVDGDLIPTTNEQPLPPLKPQISSEVPLLKQFYRPPKGIVGIDSAPVIRLLAAVAEPTAGSFISTNEQLTGRSFFSFIKRLFGKMIFAKRASGNEHGFWLSLARGINKLNEEEKR